MSGNNIIALIHGWRVPYAYGDLPITITKENKEKMRMSTLNIGWTF